MAYMNKYGGPYPSKAGEFCGNHFPGGFPLMGKCDTVEEAKDKQRKHLLRMRFGRPSHCKAGTSEEMSAQGWVGLYLKEDQPLLDGETPIETDELTEEFVTTKGKAT